MKIPLTPLKKAFTDRIRRYLTLKSMRQQDLARDMQVSNSAISQIMSGRMVPNMNQLKRMCEILGINESETQEMCDWLMQIRTGNEMEPVIPAGNDVLRTYRARRGVSISQLSKRTGVSIARLTELENNCNITPSLEDARRLASVLECNVEELIGACQQRRYIPETPYASRSFQEIREPVLPYTVRPPQSQFQPQGMLLPLIQINLLRDLFLQDPALSSLDTIETMLRVPQKLAGALAMVVADGELLGMSPDLELNILLGSNQAKIGSLVLYLSADNERFGLFRLTNAGLEDCLHAGQVVAVDMINVPLIPVMEITIRSKN